MVGAPSLFGGQLDVLGGGMTSGIAAGGLDIFGLNTSSGPSFYTKPKTVSCVFL